MSEEADQDHGLVVFWNGTSFGFIKPDGSGSRDIFFHVTELAPGQSVKRGDRVTFKTVPDKRDPAKQRAIQVQVR